MGKVGCLFTLLVAVVVAYFGLNVGEVYVRYYRFRDAMSQEVRFAKQFSDDQIRSHLRAVADSLGLPDEAGAVRVRRSANRITVSSEYFELVELPLFVRSIRFAPSFSLGL